MRRAIAWLLAALVLPAAVQAVNLTDAMIDAGPFTGTAGTAYVVTENLTWSGTGIAITFPAGAACTLDGAGYSLTISGSGATSAIQTSNSSGTCVISNLTIDKQSGSGNASTVLSTSGAVMSLHHVKITSASANANDYAARWQGANGGAEDCLFVRTVTGNVCGIGASGGQSFYNNTFIHTGTTGNALNVTSTSGTTLIKNNIFRCAGAAVPVNCTAVSGLTATFASNVYYRSNTGTVVTYPSATNYVNTGAGTNVTTLDAAAGVADPNLTGAWVIQSSSVGIIDNGTTGYTYSTDLAGATRVANGTIDRGAYELQDTTAPSAVANLAAGSATTTSIGLTWTAPGDDAGTGTATSYDVRYSTSNITDNTTFNAATTVTGEPTPGVAGTSESYTVTGLTAGTTYYFALKTSDEVPNTSAISNVPSLATTSSTTSSTSASLGARAQNSGLGKTSGLGQ